MAAPQGNRPIPLLETESSVPSTSAIPHNREAEEAVIGSVLINPQNFYDLESELDRQDFYLVRHRFIWEAFQNLRKARSPIDFLTVSDELARLGCLEEVGGPAYLTALLNQVPDSTHTQAYAQMVLAASTRREWLNYANHVAQACYSNDPPDQVEGKLHAIPLPEVKGHGNVQIVEDIALEINGDLDNPKPQAIPCHALIKDPQTGQDRIYGLENMTRDLGGLPYGEAIILAAPTQTGKTTLAYQLSEVTAFNHLKAHYVCTESTAKALMTRRAMANLGISSKLLRRGQLTDLQRQDIQTEVFRLTGLYSGLLTFDDRSSDVPTILRNTSKVRPDLLVVDHLGELRYSNDSKTIGVEENFTELRRYCKGEGVALLVVHMVDIDTTDRPQLSDLRWAKGGLSEKADIVLMMYRPDLANVRDGDEGKLQESLLARQAPVPVEIWERKDRGGPVDVLISTEYDLRKQTFMTPLMQQNILGFNLP